MCATYRRGGLQRIPQADDIAGVISLYGLQPWQHLFALHSPSIARD